MSWSTASDVVRKPGKDRQQKQSKSGERKNIDNDIRDVHTEEKSRMMVPSNNSSQAIASDETPRPHLRWETP